MDEEVLKQIDEEFENKFRKQYQSLEVDIKNKINNQVRYLIVPESMCYKSMVPAVKKSTNA